MKKLTKLFVVLLSLIALFTVAGCSHGNDDNKKGDKDTGEYEVGDFVTFGHFEQDNDVSNGNEPITWRVLDKNLSGQYLLATDKILIVEKINESCKSTTWENCTLRSYLNGFSANENIDGLDYTNDNFFNSAFTESERAKIVTSSVSVDVNPDYSVNVGNNTSDKIFILSQTEVYNYYPSANDRHLYFTTYSAMHTNDPLSFNNASGYWWLRTPGEYEEKFAYVSSSGNITETYVDNDNIGVVPAMWVNLE